jgi:energy-coupling factor transport system substrate-specific component
VKERFLSLTIYGLTTLIGLIAFLYPFWLPSLQQSGLMNQAHAKDGPFVLTFLVGLCFMVLALEIQGSGVNAKFVALLGILVSMNVILRFAEVALPGPGGFSPIFPLIILTGYIYGGRFGFLMGALTLFVSALITGTVGPWLPYQMFTAAWLGMTAPLCGWPVHLLKGEDTWLEILILGIFAALWGLLYGAIMNIWFWPFAMGDASQYWQPGIGVTATLQRYTTFYLVTSLVWDSMRAIGNFVLILAFGLPVLRVLRRFRARFAFTYVA